MEWTSGYLETPETSLADALAMRYSPATDIILNYFVKRVSNEN